jgi:inner membrane protein YidH
MPDARRPRSLYGRGGEPDPRFSMANELAGLSRFLDVVAVVLCVGGGAMAVVAVVGWRRRELAIRLGEPLPAPVALTWLGVTVAAAALVLAGYIAGTRS